jgi:hypothetical protein
MKDPATSKATMLAEQTRISKKDKPSPEQNIDTAVVSRSKVRAKAPRNSAREHINRNEELTTQRRYPESWSDSKWNDEHSISHRSRDIASSESTLRFGALLRNYR